jgi:hypothetical protein
VRSMFTLVCIRSEGHRFASSRLSFTSQSLHFSFFRYIVRDSGPIVSNARLYSCLLHQMAQFLRKSTAIVCILRLSLMLHRYVLSAVCVSTPPPHSSFYPFQLPMPVVSSISGCVRCERCCNAKRADSEDAASGLENDAVLKCQY